MADYSKPKKFFHWDVSAAEIYPLASDNPQIITLHLAICLCQQNDKKRIKIHEIFMCL